MYLLYYLVFLSVGVLTASGAPQTCDSVCERNGEFVCCNQAPSSVATGSSVCQFPFIYKGVTYTACTTKDDPEGLPWCSTQTDNNNNHLKGKFKQCQGSSSSVCQFPFIHKGVTYTACTTKDDPDGKPWCSTETDNQNNHIKGKFKQCQGQVTPAPITSTASSVCQFPFIHKGVTYTACTTKGDPDGLAWCSTQIDSQNNHIKGKWKHCQGSGSSSLLPSQCGSLGDGDRIVGGAELPMKSFMWIALLGYVQKNNPKWECGGSLISKRYVVTAAHCHSDGRPIVKVRLGEHDTSKVRDCELNVCAPPVQDFLPELVIRHDSWKLRSKYNDDIALIRLDKPAQFNGYVQPICLPSQGLNVGAFLGIRKAEVAGWGHTENGLPSTVKRAVKVPFREKDKCKDENRNPLRSFGQLCFGAADGRDSCSGDSGGPLVSNDPNNANSYVLLGIVSYGPTDCGHGDPGVYTDVSHYRDWIISNLRP